MLSRQDFDLSLDIVRAVREAVGDSVDLLIEGHSRFDVSTAVEVARRLESMRPAWFEEPVPHTNIAAMVEVARRSPVPIATGESFSSKQQFAELLKHEAVSTSATTSSRSTRADSSPRGRSPIWSTRTTACWPHTAHRVLYVRRPVSS